MGAYPTRRAGVREGAKNRVVGGVALGLGVAPISGCCDRHLNVESAGRLSRDSVVLSGSLSNEPASVTDGCSGGRDGAGDSMLTLTLQRATARRLAVGRAQVPQRICVKSSQGAPLQENCAAHGCARDSEESKARLSSHLARRPWGSAPRKGAHRVNGYAGPLV